MTPVNMRILYHTPKEGIIGDCFRCCIASLLDLYADQVPHFCDYDWKDTSGRWFTDLNKWLAPRGLSYIEMPVADGGSDSVAKWLSAVIPFGFDAYHILGGKSPRGFDHAVVARNGAIIHDPHPSRAGLVGPQSDGAYMLGLLVYRSTVGG